MEPKRLILLLVFAFSVLMLWENWNRHNAPKAPAPAVAQSGAAQNAAVPVPMSAPNGQPAVAGSAAGNAAMTESGLPDYASAAKAVVKTDTLLVQISARGGDITRVELLKHKATDDPRRDFVMLELGGEHNYVANSGVIGEGFRTDKPDFQLAPGEYNLKDGEDTLQLRMKAPAVNGVVETKVLTFHRGSYLIDVAHEIENGSAVPLKATAYFQLARDGKPAGAPPSMFGGVSTFTGPAFYTEEGKFQKVDFKKIEDNDAKFVKSAKDGWVAMVQHYFVSAFLPRGDVEREYFARKITSNFYGVGYKLPLAVDAGGKGRVESQLYVGPQEQNKLKAIAPGLNLVVDYGWVTIIAVPLFWLLSTIHGFLGNWGWSIIVVTILIKLAFFPLSAASYRSMAKMKTLMPRMKQIQERNAGDKMKQNQEMMELYKREKVNPMGGCLPIAVQIPVFIALYWVLLGVVEMRQAPWLGWITDLSVKDPYYILPLIMGATMLLQTRLNPTPPDPVQAKVMLAMPIVFTFMFLWFPSGLVLYWVLNNVLSIAQQWYITRMIERGSGKAA